MATINTVITISRQYGSGGRLIGRKLAEALDIPFYDKEIITMAAEESGYSREIFEKADEKATNSLLYSLSVNSYMMNGIPTIPDLPINDKVFLIQSEIIRKLAAKGPCVLVGRCSDYILEKHEKAINIFIDSDFEDRVNRAVNVYGVNPDKANDIVQKYDKQRAAYYNFYTNRRWGAVANYDLCINSNLLGIDGTAELLKNFVEKVQPNRLK